ncbi:MAG: ATP-binding protein [Nanoarchaeota archaeon]|nr:ATP-binding protein [Nanoarchaeota archaeon]
MEEKFIKEYIEKANPWWSEKFDISWFKDREIYKNMLKFIKTRQIIALTGLRRVGKTSIMKRIIKEYLNKNFPKKNIFYFSFDDFSNIRLMELLDIYETIIEKKIKNEKFVIIFDEIQKLNNWSEQMKVIYDLYPNIKFIISGSESLFIRKKSKESLAGRIFEFKVETLSFKEFLEFKNIKIDNIWLQRELLIKNFLEYIKNNGFPEMIGEEDDVVEKYIKEGVIEKIIYRDIPEVFEIKDSGLMKSLFDVIYNNPGQIIEIQNLASELNVSRQILSMYLEYLEESYLIRKLYNFSKNARKVQRKLKRYYPAIVNPLLIKHDFPKVFEQVIVNELKGEFFWRDVYKNEVDLILTKPEFIAIEIKSGEIKSRDLSPLEKFNKKYKPKKAIVISYNTDKKINSIEVIPFYKYLLKEAKK